MTTPSSQDISKQAFTAINILSGINKLTIKAFSSKKKQALIFLILNDTNQVCRYDRAALWKMDGEKPRLLGVSGQATISTTSEIASRWTRLVKDLNPKDKNGILSAENFTENKALWDEYVQQSFKPSVLWLPIFSNEKLSLGLWLERWEGEGWNVHDAEILGLLTQAYGISWEKFSSRFVLSKYSKLLWSLGFALLLLSFIVRIPLRVVAPCEVVPKDPYLVTAPLEDIIDSVKVKPGQNVKAGDVLFEYDKRVALQTLRIAEDQVQIAQQDLNRAKTLAFKDEKSLAEVVVLMAKLKKEQANLDLAKYRASQLVVQTPEDGIALIEDPDQWRGKPVKVGEKVLMIIEPKQTKIRLWIPEDDNITFNFSEPIRIFLNVTPTVTRLARLNFISNASIVTDKHVVSFMAEGDWIESQSDVKVGLKGSAILYGEKVSFFYWLVRKPWIFIREFLGF